MRSGSEQESPSKFSPPITALNKSKNAAYTIFDVSGISHSSPRGVTQSNNFSVLRCFLLLGNEVEPLPPKMNPFVELMPFSIKIYARFQTKIIRTYSLSGMCSDSLFFTVILRIDKSKS